METLFKLLFNNAPNRSTPGTEGDTGEMFLSLLSYQVFVTGLIVGHLCCLDTFLSGNFKSGSFVSITELSTCFRTCLFKGLDMLNLVIFAFCFLFLLVCITFDLSWARNFFLALFSLFE